MSSSCCGPLLGWPAFGLLLPRVSDPRIEVSAEVGMEDRPKGVRASVATNTKRGVWAFLALTGCRRGEAIALKWSDVDLDAGKATVRASRGRVGRQVVTDSPKSGRIRVIDLDPGLVQMLGGVLEEQRRHRRLIGAAYQTGRVCVHRLDGKRSES